MASKVTDVGLIYAHWCGHCKKILPIWIKNIEPKGSNDLKVYTIESFEFDKIKKNPQHKLSKIQVNGYPTIFKIDTKGIITIFNDNPNDGNREDPKNIMKWIGIEPKKGGSRRKKKTISKKGKRKGGCGCGTRKKWFNWF